MRGKWERDAVPAVPLTLMPGGPGMDKGEKMRDQIGLLAGKVWQTVGKEPGILMSLLAKTQGVDPSLAVFATGWLSREDKVRVEPLGRDFKVWLTDKEQEAWKGAQKKG